MLISKFFKNAAESWHRRFYSNSAPIDIQGYSWSYVEFVCQVSVAKFDYWRSKIDTEKPQKSHIIEIYARISKRTESQFMSLIFGVDLTLNQKIMYFFLSKFCTVRGWVIFTHFCHKNSRKPHNHLFLMRKLIVCPNSCSFVLTEKRQKSHIRFYLMILQIFNKKNVAETWRKDFLTVFPSQKIHGKFLLQILVSLVLQNYDKNFNFLIFFILTRPT